MKKTFAMVIAALLVAFVMASCGDKEADAAQQPEAAAASTPVVMGALTERDFTRYLELKGTLLPKDQAVISTRVGGTLKEIRVEEGESVTAGQVLFIIDDQTYRDKVEVAQATVSAQEGAAEVARAQLQKAQAALHKAKLDVERYQRLYEKKTVSSNELEAYTLNFETSTADVALAQANVTAQDAQVALAKASLAISQKALSDCVIKAPIDGIVSARYHDAGEEVGGDAKILKVVDTRQLRAVAAVPAEYYSVIKPNETRLRLTVGEGGPAKEVVVTDKNPVIESGLRTFQIRALFENEAQMPLVPGELVTIAVVLEKSHGLGVARGVPVRRTSGLLLYTVEDGKAKSISVVEGITEDGVTQVSAEGLTADTPIVIEGQYMIQDGMAVQTR